jgi:molecular chaperone HtpG
MRTGNLSVQTENILPIIKRYLYSDQEIFLRELVSNAVDATQKLKNPCRPRRSERRYRRYNRDRKPRPR